MKKLGLLLSVLVLVSCAPQPTPDLKATETAIAYNVLATLTAQVPSPAPTPVVTDTPKPTNTPRPTNTPPPTHTPMPTNTPTPTPIPLSELRLEPLLIQPGDLPAGFSVAQVKDVAPSMFDDLPSAENTIDQRFERGGDTAGGVTVFLYDSTSEIEEAYALLMSIEADYVALLTGGMNVQTVTGVGEQAIVSVLSLSVGGFTLESSDLAFIRCNAVVHIRMAGVVDIDTIKAYAKRLDSRLEPVVCQSNIAKAAYMPIPTVNPETLATGTAFVGMIETIVPRLTETPSLETEATYLNSVTDVLEDYQTFVDRWVPRIAYTTLSDYEICLDILSETKLMDVPELYKASHRELIKTIDCLCESVGAAYTQDYDAAKDWYDQTQAHYETWRDEYDKVSQ